MNYPRLVSRGRNNNKTQVNFMGSWGKGGEGTKHMHT
jgi:hypothetical protein